MDLELVGKRALVTGSSSGIGIGIAIALAREGAEVIVHGRNRERTHDVTDTIRASGGSAFAVFGDLATQGGAAAVVEAVGSQCEGIDILVNNVGGTESTGDQRAWFAIDPENWAGTMQQNVLSAVRMIHAFVPRMRDAGWGRVINIASAGGTQAVDTVPDYCAAKAALISMTVSLSKALARSGVTVNTVSPGCTRTQAFERSLDRVAQGHDWPEDYESREAKFMDLGIFPCASERYGRPDDIGALVAFLASPHSTFINGANYRIDGGQCQSVN